MRSIVALVALVAVLGAVAELAAPALVASRVEDLVAAHTGDQVAVDADVGAFPFVPALLLDGRMDRLAVSLDRVAGTELPLARVTFEIDGVQLDRDRLFAGEAEVTDLDRGRVTALIDDRAVDGEVVPESIDVRGDVVALAGSELPVPTGLLPCAPASTSTDSGPALTCTFEHVPGLLARAAR